MTRFEDFQYCPLGGHLRYWNRTILAILKLYVAQTPPIKFGLNPHYGLGGDEVWRISRWLPWLASWMSEWKEFSSFWISLSPQSLPASFSLIRLTIQKQTSFQDFQAGHHDGHLGYWNETTLAILNLHVTPMPPTKFGLNLCRSRHGFKIFNMATVGAISDTGAERFLAILNLYVALMPPIKFQLNWTYSLGGDVFWRFSRWPTWRLSCISE